MMERLRESKSMEAEEKARLEEEIAAKAEEVQHIQAAVNISLCLGTQLLNVTCIEYLISDHQVKVVCL